MSSLKSRGDFPMQSRRLFPIIHRLFGFTRITASGIIRKHLIAVLLAAVVTSLSIPPQIASATFLETIDRLGDALNRHGAGLAISQPSVLQGAAYRSGEMLVRFKAGVSQNDRDMIAATQGARRKKQLRGESAIEKLEFTSGNDPAAMAAQLILNPQIEFAEPNYLIAKDQAETTPNDPRFAEQWAIKNIGQNGGQYGSDIGVALAWNKTTGAQSTTIAIIDSGVDFSHPDLAGNQWTNSHPTTGDTHGWDYITDTGDVKDEYGHGTAIAGIIAAQGNNSAGVSGVMWRASLMSLRVLDNTGTGDVASAVEAIDYAIAHGAQVINLSWGTPAASSR